MILKEQCIVKFNQANKNGRVYSSDCFNLEDPIIQEKLKTGTFFGELGIPEDREEVDFLEISHRVTNLYKRDDGLYADIETLDTPNGEILEEIIKNGSQGGFRTRGHGTLIHRDDGNYDVVDYVFITIDYTDNPA